MNRLPSNLRALVFFLLAGSVATAGQAATLAFVGTQYDIGGTFYPTYSYPQNSIVPWRSSSTDNIYAASQEGGQQYYGRDGYALFGTRFDFPDANSFPGFAFNDPADDSLYPNIVQLPDFIADSQILAQRKSGGWAYALIDDPRLQAGFRQWTFDGVNYPPADGTNTTGVVPYVKLGVLDGLDTLGNNPATGPAGRWGFEVGENAPAHFRIGVMTDGLDGTQHSPGEVFLLQVGGSMVSSGTLVRNRFVDMHFFDVIGAQPGDQFAVAAQVAVGGQNAGISGFSFDVISDVVTEDADFDQNGVVDGADFLAWQRGYGGSGLANGDANNDGVVNDLDLAIWKAQFGSPSSVAAAAAVPEPATALLAALAVGGLIRRRK